MAQPPPPYSHHSDAFQTPFHFAIIHSRHPPSKHYSNIKPRSRHCSNAIHFASKYLPDPIQTLSRHQSTIQTPEIAKRGTDTGGGQKQKGGAHSM